MSQTATKTNTVTDPVCGMSVNPETTELEVTLEGQTYYFCAEGCRRAFEEDPGKFLNPECIKPKGWWGRYMQRLQKATGGKPIKCH